MIRRYFTLRFGTGELDEIYHLITGPSIEKPLATDDDDDDKENQDYIVLQGHRIYNQLSMNSEDNTDVYTEYVYQQDQRLSSIHSRSFSFFFLFSI